MEKEKLSQIISAGLRTGLSGIPGCSWIAQAWSEYDSFKQSERINTFFRKFSEALRKVEEHIKKHGSYLRSSGEVPSLIERTVDFVRKEPSELKIGKYSTLLANCFSAGPEIQAEKKLDYIVLLEFLTEDDLKVLGAFYPDKNIRVEKMHEHLLDIGGKPTKENISALIFSLSKLESRALISQTEDNLGHQVWSGPIDNWRNRWLFKHYTILSPGRILIKFLNE